MTTINNDRTTTQILDEVGEVLILKRKGSIVVTESISSNEGISVEDEAGDTKVVIEGDVRAFDSNGQGIGINSYGDNMRVTVKKSGSVEGSYGIFCNGEAPILINSGHISGTTNAGVGSNTFFTIRNSGSISGDRGLGLFGGGDVTNSGMITGASVGIYAHNIRDYTIDNFGTIKGLSGTAIMLDAGEDHVVNAGKIVGDVLLGAGNDHFAIRRGSVLGDIIGEGGDDTLTTNNAKYKLVEDAGDGFDTVKSSVSYRLNEHVENLVLTGKKSINGTGDGTNMVETNYFHGNSGNNVLKGVGLGDNEFYGGRGQDTYIGVDGQYDIYGLGRGDGKDTAKTFVQGEDVVNLNGFDGFDYETPFETLQSHFKQKGDDTWINMGKGDILILENTDKDTLEHSDFLFNF